MNKEQRIWKIWNLKNLQNVLYFTCNYTDNQYYVKSEKGKCSQNDTRIVLPLSVEKGCVQLPQNRVKLPIEAHYSTKHILTVWIGICFPFYPFLAWKERARSRCRMQRIWERGNKGMKSGQYIVDILMGMESSDNWNVFLFPFIVNRGISLYNDRGGCQNDNPLHLIAKSEVQHSGYILTKCFNFLAIKLRLVTPLYICSHIDTLEIDNGIALKLFNKQFSWFIQLNI